MKMINQNKKRSKRKDYNALILTLDDIKEILDIILENKKEEDKIFIQIGNYELEDANEILILIDEDVPGEKFDEVNVSFGKWGYESYSFRITSSYSYAECDASNLINLGIFQKIDEILTSKQRKIPAFFSTSVGLLLMFLITFSLCVLIGSFFKSLSLSSILISFGFIITYPVHNFFRKNILYQKKEASFFKRNQDSIKVGILVAIFTTICTVLLEVIKGTMQK